MIKSDIVFHSLPTAKRAGASDHLPRFLPTVYGHGRPILNLTKLSHSNIVYLRYLWNLLSLRAHRPLILNV